MQVPVLSARGIQIGSKTRVIVFFWFCVPKLQIEFELWFEREKKTRYNDLRNE